MPRRGEDGRLCCVPPVFAQEGLSCGAKTVRGIPAISYRRGSALGSPCKGSCRRSWLRGNYLSLRPFGALPSSEGGFHAVQKPKNRSTETTANSMAFRNLPQNSFLSKSKRTGASRPFFAYRLAHRGNHRSAALHYRRPPLCFSFFVYASASVCFLLSAKNIATMPAPTAMNTYQGR